MAAARALSARRRAHLAVFGATTLTARVVKEQLVERSFPVASMRLFSDREDPEMNLTEFGGEAKMVTVPDIDALDDLDIAFLCGTPEEISRYLDWGGVKGFAAIDLTAASIENTRTPIVSAAINAADIPRGPGVIATPHPIALFLSALLDPVRRGCGLEEVMIVVIQPASESGQEGIEELYRQTVGVLNFQDPPREVFARQLAFNLIPSFLQGPGLATSGGSPASLEKQVRRVTGGKYGLTVELVQAPIFHCHAALARVVLPAGRRREDLVEAFRSSGEVQVSGAGEPATPAERAGRPGVQVTALREAAGPSAFWVWAVFDDMISGAALNAVRIAETLHKRGPGRSDG